MQTVSPVLFKLDQGRMQCIVRCMAASLTCWAVDVMARRATTAKVFDIEVKENVVHCVSELCTPKGNCEACCCLSRDRTKPASLFVSRSMQDFHFL